MSFSTWIFVEDVFVLEGEVMDDLVVFFFLSCEAHLQTCETSRTATSKPAKKTLETIYQEASQRQASWEGQRDKAPKTTTPSYSVCFCLVIILLCTTKKLSEKKHNFGMFFLGCFFSNHL